MTIERKNIKSFWLSSFVSWSSSDKHLLHNMSNEKNTLVHEFVSIFNYVELLFKLIFISLSNELLKFLKRLSIPSELVRTASFFYWKKVDLVKSILVNNKKYRTPHTELLHTPGLDFSKETRNLAAQIKEKLQLEFEIFEFFFSRSQDQYLRLKREMSHLRMIYKWRKQNNRYFSIYRGVDIKRRSINYQTRVNKLQKITFLKCMLYGQQIHTVHANPSIVKFSRDDQSPSHLSWLIPDSG